MNLKFVIACAVAALSATSANAEIVTYRLADARFIDGGSATGTISFDTTKQPLAGFGTDQFITAFDIVTEAGSGIGNFGLSFNYSSFNYTNINSTNSVSFRQDSTQFNGVNIGFGSLTDNRSFGFNVLSIPVDFGRTTAIPINFAFPTSNQECQGFCGVRILTSGSLALVSSAVPEPATWALMLVGFGMAGTALRRRKRIAAAVA